jgi:hypothetical protein
LARPNSFFQRPVRSFPTRIRFLCDSRSSTYCPIFCSAAATSSCVPVRNRHPGRAFHCSAYFFSAAGVSVAGSTVMEMSQTSRPMRSPSCSCTCWNVFDMTGQLPVQEAKNVLITTTLSFIRSS